MSVEKVKILCVDDDQTALGALHRLFAANARYQVFSAESGHAGLAILETEKDVLLVISNYRLPGMDGIEFLCKVKEYRPETIRIVLSGHTETAAVAEAINQGQIYKFISKPWRAEELDSAVSMALQHQELQLQNRRLTVELQKKNQQLQEINGKLEGLVGQRTEALEIRNRVLQIAQGILDVLPVVVFGIDPDEMIVHCNEYACQLFPYGGIGPLGNDRYEVFSAEINDLIDRLGTERAPQAIIEVQNKSYRAEVRRLHETLTQGTVLVLIPSS